MVRGLLWLPWGQREGEGKGTSVGRRLLRSSQSALLVTRLSGGSRDKEKDLDVLGDGMGRNC